MKYLDDIRANAAGQSVITAAKVAEDCGLELWQARKVLNRLARMGELEPLPRRNCNAPGRWVNKALFSNDAAQGPS